MRNGRNRTGSPKPQRVELGRYIVADPEICHGKPTFKGTRIMVWQVLDDVAEGRSWDFNRPFGPPAYCLVWLEVSADDAARCVRRFLRHPRFHSQAKRMGLVVRVHPEGIHFWQLNRATLRSAAWSEH